MAVSDAKCSWALELGRQRRFLQRFRHYFINPHTLLSSAKRNHDGQVRESVPISSFQRNEWVICFLWLCTRWIHSSSLTFFCNLLISVYEMCSAVLLFFNIELGFQSRCIEFICFRWMLSLCCIWCYFWFFVFASGFWWISDWCAVYVKCVEQTNKCCVVFLSVELW